MIDEGKNMGSRHPRSTIRTRIISPGRRSVVFRRMPGNGWAKKFCAENNQHLFDYHIPKADKPDF